MNNNNSSKHGIKKVNIRMMAEREGVETTPRTINSDAVTMTMTGRRAQEAASQR